MKRLLVAILLATAGAPAGGSVVGHIDGYTILSRSATEGLRSSSASPCSSPTESVSRTVSMH
jgi:hypothetical protein